MHARQIAQRAIAATQGGAFRDEILAIDGLDKEGEVVRHDVDEGIRFDVSIEGMRGRAIRREVYERVSAVGIALVLLIFFVSLTSDIGRLSGG